MYVKIKVPKIWELVFNLVVKTMLSVLGGCMFKIQNDQSFLDIK